MKNSLLTFSIFLLAFSQNTFGALSAGDIAFVAFNADGDDDFAIVLLAGVTNEIIYFTDNNSNGSGGINNNEGIIKWVSGATSIDAGTIIIFTDAGNSSTLSSSLGTLSNEDGDFNLSASGDCILAYQTGSPITFLAGIRNEDEPSAGEITGTGLTEGTTFITFSTTNRDGGEYTGTREGQVEFSEYLTLVNIASNWTTYSANGELILPIPTTTFSIVGGLPITLTSFEAKPTNQKSINLTWQTASEENNDYFSIEHSAGGTSFREIAIQVGNGTTNIVQNYSFLHENVANGLNYYRLKQIDFDEKFEYSNIVTAKASHSYDDIILTPNPTSNVILIQTKTPYQRNADFQILNMQGQVVLSSVLQAGATDLELNIADFPVGIYYLQLFVDNDVMMKKIIKQ
jgi:hypothetical protein